MKVLSIVGARPNFMKIASIARAIEEHNSKCGYPWIEHTIVHTGQHYDEQMSKLFFEELKIPRPNYNLEVGSASHAIQTAEIMARFEPLLIAEHPDVLILVGDVNSTVACALVASKITYNGTPGRKRPLIAHVEAGLRSFDRDMPEEINRILTDALSDFLFTTEKEAASNLEHEGISSEKIYFVGNVMIDTLIRFRQKALELHTLEDILKENYRKKQADDLQSPPSSPYGLVTLHRPSNVDTYDALKSLIDCLKSIASRISLIFPLHPRTESNLKHFGLYAMLEEHDGIILTKPLGYMEFLRLLIDAALVLTDSGGIQEETTFLHVPCITLRSTTERPVTVKTGSNYLVGTDPDKISQTAFSIIDGYKKEGLTPALWDGKAGERIIEILSKSVVDVSIH